MKEFEINQRIYQLTESLNMRELSVDGTPGAYTIVGKNREDLIEQYYLVLTLPIEHELSAINMRVNSIINALRVNDGKTCLFTATYRENLANKLVEILKIEL